MLTMKKILYMLYALIPVLASCSEEIDLQGNAGKDCITLTVFNSPMTKADAGPDYERHLTRLDVFFYVEGQTDRPCIYYQEVTDRKYLDGGAGEIPFYVVEEQINEIFPDGNTNCDVFVIANLPEDKRPGTFASKAEGTELNRLNAILLNLTEGDYDSVGKDFIMAGFDGNVQKDNNNNASGTVKLIRAASKVTVTVNVPEKITLTDDLGNPGSTMVPVWEDNTGDITLKTSFHNGVSMGHIYPAGMVDDGMSVLPDECFFNTEKVIYEYVKEIPAEGADGMKKHQFTCSVPFYSYPNAWQKGDVHAAYLTFELPWKNQDDDQYHTYYYQILVNGGGRRLDPNHWYDLTVNVGVIGSRVESNPVELQDMTIYVLDWTTEPDPEDSAGGDRYEDVQIEQYTYFTVSQKRIEMNNTKLGTVSFEASHGVKWALEWPTGEDADHIIEGFDQMEKDYNDKNNYRFSAYYVNCGSTPVATSLTGYIQEDDFSLSETGHSIVFTYPDGITLDIYSPVYVHLKVWLDIDGQGDEPNGIETEFVEHVTFVYYPAMYIVPELSITGSVYVNGYNKTRASNDVITINDRYDLGGAPGTDDSKYMHIITVSSFTKDDTFTLDNQPVSYIIGDPRVRKSDTNLNNDGFINDGWAEDHEGTTLVDYYPTSVEGDAYRVVSPKFRISSKLGGYSSGDAEGAAMRCASYQENGYPAGRWRLPTTAEVMFVVDLQTKGVIQTLFYGSSWYFSATHRVRNYNNTVQVQDKDGNDHSVRCVYDEWYWGSNQDAQPNPDADPEEGDEFLFTWGDKPIWDENGNPL